MKHVVLLAATLCSFSATAQQQVSDNAIAAAQDAYGISVGSESLGLYSASEVRGFSPFSAGNVRMQGLYFDQQGSMTGRLTAGSTIRIGFTTLNFPFPAPTGIVDWELRSVGNELSAIAKLYAGPFDAYQADFDAQIPIAPGLGVAAGAAYNRSEWLPGSTSDIIGLGVSPEWSLSEAVQLRAFWGTREVTHEKTMPLIFVEGSGVPRVEREFWGQDWAESEYRSTHMGLLGSVRASDAWTVRAGVFHSSYTSERTFTDLYLDTDAQGSADHLMVVDPLQKSTSTSGEIRADWANFSSGAWRHSMHFTLRGREVSARYGGSDVLDLGRALAGQHEDIEEPDFSFEASQGDEVRQWAGGVSYSMALQDRGEVIFGLQKTDYRKTARTSASESSTRRDTPWLYNVQGAARIYGPWALYAGYTRGLEDAGVAPDNAVNRGQVLGAQQTVQRDAGIRYAFSPSLQFVAALFEIEKPHFSLDASSSYSSVGKERRRGVELSIAGDLTERLIVVAGAAFAQPEVTSTDGASTRSYVPPGQAKQLAQVHFDYTFARWPAASVDMSLSHEGRKAVTVDGLEAPSRTALDLGARYQFTVGKLPASLRLQLWNITDEYGWYVYQSGALEPFEPRRAQVYVAVDL